MVCQLFLKFFHGVGESWDVVVGALGEMGVFGVLVVSVRMGRKKKFWGFASPRIFTI